MKLDPRDTRAFYDAAVLGLRFLDARSGAARRFGPDANARWKLFAGHLLPRDRVDLLLRDAAVRHPLGFAPRAVFNLMGLAADEPFGPDWPGPDPASTHRLLEAGSSNGFDPVASLAEAANAWRVARTELPQDTFTDLSPGSQVLVSGASAVLATARVFATRGGLDFADQVTLVTTRPAERQLFGLAAALLDTTAPLRCLVPAGLREATTAGSLRPFDIVATSPDTTPEVSRTLAELGI